MQNEQTQVEQEAQSAEQAFQAPANQADQTTEGITDQSQGITAEGQPQEQEQSQAEVEIPESLKGFQNEDGSLDYDKLTNAYIENDKLKGKLGEETGNLRNMILQQHHQMQELNKRLEEQGQKAPDKGLAELTPEQLGINLDDFNGTLAPEDYKVIGDIVAKTIEARETHKNRAQQEQSQNFQKSMQEQVKNAATMVFQELSASDPHILSEARQLEIDAEMAKNPAYVERFRQHLSGQNPLSYNEIKEAIAQTNSIIKQKDEEVKKQHAQEAAKILADQYGLAQKQQAVGAVAQPSNSHVAANGQNPNSGMPPIDARGQAPEYVAALKANFPGVPIIE